jgi:hypothetical protein
MRSSLHREVRRLRGDRCDQDPGTAASIRRNVLSYAARSQTTPPKANSIQPPPIIRKAPGQRDRVTRCPIPPCCPGFRQHKRAPRSAETRSKIASGLSEIPP